MPTLVLRTVKGTPLTNSEVDGNFSNLNSAIGETTNLLTDDTSNLVSAINEVRASVLGVESSAIANGNSEVRVTASNSTIYANVTGYSAVVLERYSTTANIKLKGNVQDATGRTLKILDEGGNVVWGE